MGRDELYSDSWGELTTYSCKAEADFIERGGIEKRLEMIETAREIRECQVREMFLDALEIPRDSKCRDCAWLQEGIIDQYSPDDDNCLPEYAFDIARRMCEVCKATGGDDEALTAFFKGVDEE
jgi:hypothetical protein